MNQAERKREAIDRLMVETNASMAEVRHRYPGWVGECMAYRMGMCAISHARAIAAYTSPKKGEVVAVVGPNVS